MEEERNTKIVTFRFDGEDYFLKVRLHDNDKPIGIDVTTRFSGSELARAVNAWAYSVSIGLESGISVERLFQLPKDERYGIFHYTLVDYMSKHMLENFGKKS